MHGSIAIALMILLTAAWPQATLAFCGPPLNMNHWGRPADHRNPEETERLNLVERYHFTPEIEALKDGKNGPLPGDIHYTLIQFVNHYRALQAMATWQLTNPCRQDQECFPADCYFERALAFTPDDPTIYLIWGNYAYRKNEHDRALEIYRRAEALAPENAEVLYNLGLLQVERKDYSSARDYAVKAYGRGHPLPGLRNRLKRAGVKLDPAEIAAVRAAVAAAAQSP